MSLAVLADRAPLVRTVRSCTVANTLSIGFDVRRWSQCSAGKSKKASRASRSFVRHDCLVVPGTVLVGEYIDGRFDCRAGRRTENFTKVCLHVDLDREGNLVQHVRGLVNPTPLVPGTRKDLFDCLPEASAPSPTARSGAISSPRCLMSMCSSRQLWALSRAPVWKPTSSFLPSGVAPISTSIHSAVGSIRACK